MPQMRSVNIHNAQNKGTQHKSMVKLVFTGWIQWRIQWAPPPGPNYFISMLQGKNSFKCIDPFMFYHPLLKPSPTTEEKKSSFNRIVRDEDLCWDLKETVSRDRALCSKRRGDGICYFAALWERLHWHRNPDVSVKPSVRPTLSRLCSVLYGFELCTRVRQE